MKFCRVHHRAFGKGLPVMLIALGLAWAVYAEEKPTERRSPQAKATKSSTAQNQRLELTEPVHRVPKKESIQASSVATVSQSQAQAPQHPLMPALQMAKASLRIIDNGIKDYQCTLIKRERINHKLGNYEAIFVKVRHEPFSVYMRFLGPKSVKGRECIYVENKNEGKLIAREGSGIKRKLGVFHLVPTGMLAMQGQKYPITEIGIRTLTNRLVEVAENDIQFGECDVQWFKNTTIGNKTNARKCMCLQVTHPTPRKEFRFHMARIYIDDEWKIPIRYEAYLWPGSDGKPQLDEEYTYMNFKFNNGFTDQDFEERNETYNFHN